MISKKDEMLEQAAEYFKKGYFFEAEELFEKRHTKDLENNQLILKLADIAVLSNNLSQAEKYLTLILEKDSKNKKAISLLAEVYYRQDLFQKAAPLFQKLGLKGKAEKLKQFGKKKPYILECEKEETSVNFVITDPLPIIKVQINENEVVNFLIDTGGAELIIAEDYANPTRFRNLWGVWWIFRRR